MATRVATPLARQVDTWTRPDRGGVHAYHTERAAAEPAWAGSSGSAPARTSVPLRDASSPDSAVAAASRSLDGGKPRTNEPSAAFLASTAMKYSVAACAVKRTLLAPETQPEPSSDAAIAVSTPASA